MTHALKKVIRNALSGAGLAVGPFAPKADIQALIARLHPVTTDKPLIRLGGEHDGGYLAPDDLEGVAACFSPGVDVTASFEEALIRRGVPCYLADASVPGAPMDHPLIHFQKKFLGVVDDETTLTLDSWVAACAPPVGDLVLQMDIEGAEWPVLLNVSTPVLRRFRIVVLELHHMERMFEKYAFPLTKAVFDRLLAHFHVVHNHPNNTGPLALARGLRVPPLLEMTFVRKDRVEVTGFARSFPHPMDRPNVERAPEIVLPNDWWDARRAGSPGQAS